MSRRVLLGVCDNDELGDTYRPAGDEENKPGHIDLSRMRILVTGETIEVGIGIPP